MSFVESAGELLDLRGEVCPFTSVRTRLALEAMSFGARLEVVVDHPPAIDNLPRSARSWGESVIRVDEIGEGIWRITIIKQSGEQPQATASRPRIYLDHNATTPLSRRVRELMIGALEKLPGNPSSTHAEGRAARDAIEGSRRAVADLLAADPKELTFTGGGTEAVALGIIGLARLAGASSERLLLVPAIEHPATHGAAAALAAEGWRCLTIAVDEQGRIEKDSLSAAVRGGGGVLALALANHEIGTIQEVAELSELAHRHGVRVFCDAVQAAGKLPIDVAELGADALSISGHKFYGPKGVGALWVRSSLDLEPLFPGGHQERQRRPGTENTAAIVGIGEAARLAVAEWLPAQPRIARLRALLEQQLTAIGGVRIHGGDADRVGNTSNVGFESALGEVVAGALDLAGIAVSTGAACTSGLHQPSPVLLGLGLTPDRAAEAVRFSLGVATSRDEITAVGAALPAIVERARRYR